MSGPMPHAEMRERWKAGETLQDIAEKARRRNGMGRAAVREVLFQERAACPCDI